MKHLELVRWIKVILVAAALLGLAFGFLLIPQLGRDAVRQNPELAYMFWPTLLFFWLTAIPFFVALGCSWNIACEIAADRSFSEKNAHSLKMISRLALLECTLYVGGIAALFAADVMHPGLLLFAMLIIFCGATLALISALASRLVLKAWEMKQDQDLTI